jgi:hypothetical protein
MVTGVIYTICALAIVAGTIVVFRVQSSKSARSIAVSKESPAAVWTGGLKTGSISSTWGTARLELFSWGIRIRGLWFWRLILPNWEARYTELLSAQLVRWPIANSGVLIGTDGTAAPIVFTTPAGSKVLDALEAHGIPVDRTVDRLRMAQHLR